VREDLADGPWFGDERDQSDVTAAARTGTFLEINANPWRLDLNDHHAAAAKKPA